MVNNFPAIKLELLRDGYSSLKGFFSDAELVAIDEASVGLIQAWEKGAREDKDYWSYFNPEQGDILYRLHNLEKQKHPAFDAFLADSRLRMAVEMLYGFPAEPSAHALIIKMPRKGGPVPWHRDPVKVPAGCVYNFSIFLDDATPENGCLEFLPASHLFPPNYEVVDRRPKESIFMPLRKGDVAIHDVRVMHGSGPSVGDTMRRSIVIEFCPSWILQLMREERLP